MSTPYKLVTFSELVLDNDKPLFFDVETCGFYQRIRLAQFFQEGNDEVQMIEWPEPVLLCALLNNFKFVAHNVHYEITTLQQQTDTRWIPPAYECTLLLDRLHHYRAEKFSLDAALERTIGHCPYKAQSLDKAKLQKSNWKADRLTTDQLLYAATDVYHMPELYKLIKHEEESMSYKLDKLTLGYCLDFQWNGMPIDHERIATHLNENNTRIAEIALPVNCNSWQQVRPYIDSKHSDALGLAMATLKGNDRAKDVNETRKLIKQNSFLKKYDNMIELIGKFMPNARSGRLVSKDENKQQIPRKLKDCFGGELMVYADYAQLELRTIACITNCSLMVKMFKEGVDIHNFTTEMIFGKEWTKTQRQLTKTANFNFLYGGGVGVFISILILQASLWLEEREGYSLRKKWRSLWNEIYTWQQRGINAWKKGKPWTTPLGRRYVGKMMTDQLNIQNQGAGAEVAKLALHYMMPKLTALGGCCLVNFIHDSFIVKVDNHDLEIAKRVAVIIADSMQEAWTEMSKLFLIKDLPMPVNVLVGENWGDMENGDFIWELKQ